MADRDAPNDTKGSKDCEVGYGKPPKATQFAPGKSGNPKGRPKGARTIGAMLQQMIRQKFAVTENGRMVRKSAIEIALHRLRTDAMRGDPRARKDFFALIDRYGASGDVSPQLKELLDEDRDILAHYLPKLVAAAASDGPGDEQSE